jgi:hypothetical protein
MKKKPGKRRATKEQKPTTGGSYWIDFDDDGRPRASIASGVVLTADELCIPRQGGLHAVVTARNWPAGDVLHTDALNLVHEKARRGFVRTCANVGGEHLLALLQQCRLWLDRRAAATEATAHASTGNDAQRPPRMRLTGAQSFVDGTLVYLLYYEDTGIVCVTSTDGVVPQPETRFIFDPPNLPTKATPALIDAIVNDVPAADGATLVRELVALLERHVVWPHRGVPWLVALWVMATYLFRVFTFFPYLVLQSVDKRSGKSLVLEILAEVAWNAVSSVPPSAAALFRDIHVNATTMLLDEVEHLGNVNKDDQGAVLAVLNAGFKYDAMVARCEKRDDVWVSVRYRAYSPKAFASIKALADVIRDRSVVVRMKRRHKDEKVARFRLRQAAPMLAALRDRLHHWALANAQHVADLADAEDCFPMPKDVDDRARDILEPLYAVAGVIDVMAGDAACTTQLTAAVVEIMKVRTGDANDTTVADAIQALLDRLDTAPRGLLGKATDEIVLKAAEAVQVFADGGLDWVEKPKHARSLFRQLGIYSGSHRPPENKKKVKRGYKITRADLADLAARYLPAEPPEEERKEAAG